MLTDIKNLSHNITDYTQNGHCDNCGSCCSQFLLISAKERKEIIRYCKKHPESIAVPLLFLPINSEKAMISQCPFRDHSNKKCLIYPVRPQICRSFMCNAPAAALRMRTMLSKRFEETNMFNIVEELLDE